MNRGIPQSPPSELAEFKAASTGEIAGRFHLSLKTVDVHRAHNKEKLDLKTTPEFTRFAIRWVASQGGPKASQCLAESHFRPPTRPHSGCGARRSAADGESHVLWRNSLALRLNWRKGRDSNPR